MSPCIYPSSVGRYFTMKKTSKLKSSAHNLLWLWRTATCTGPQKSDGLGYIEITIKRTFFKICIPFAACEAERSLFFQIFLTCYIVVLIHFVYLRGPSNNISTKVRMALRFLALSGLSLCTDILPKIHLQDKFAVLYSSQVPIFKFFRQISFGHDNANIS